MSGWLMAHPLRIICCNPSEDCTASPRLHWPFGLLHPWQRLLKALQHLPNPVEHGHLVAYINKSMKGVREEEVQGLDLNDLHAVVGFIKEHMACAALPTFTICRTPFETAANTSAMNDSQPATGFSTHSWDTQDPAAAGEVSCKHDDASLCRRTQISLSMMTSSLLSDASTLPCTHSGTTLPSCGSAQLAMLGEADELAAATGLTPEDPFLAAVAPHYRWSMSGCQGFVSIQEGVNAGRRAACTLLASQGSGGGKWHLPQDTPGPPPVELSSQQVQQQLQLMAHGLIGKGSTCMVFKCQWAERFGHKSLLTAKVLRNPYCDNLQQVLSSFKHEADVLSRCRHCNIVRLYGYCLEPPTVCLIMELLPHSLATWLAQHAEHGLRHGAGTATASSSPLHMQPATDITLGSSSSHSASTLSFPSTTGFASQEQSEAGWGVHSQSNGAVSSLQSCGPYTELAGCLQESSAGLSRLGETGQAKQGPMHPHTDVDLLQIGIDVAAGLEYLHAEPGQRQRETGDEVEEEEGPVLGRVVHASLTPAHIHINSQGVAKIRGFGLPMEHHASPSCWGPYPVATRHYMAPKLAYNLPDTNLADRVDIYSLGMILWELAVGEVPWGGLQDQQTPPVVAAGSQLPLASLGPGDDSLLQRCPGVAALVAACCHAQPQQRPTASEVRARLAWEVERLRAPAGVPQQEAAWWPPSSDSDSTDSDYEW